MHHTIVLPLIRIHQVKNIMFHKYPCLAFFVNFIFYYLLIIFITVFIWWLINPYFNDKLSFSKFYETSIVCLSVCALVPICLSIRFSTDLKSCDVTTHLHLRLSCFYFMFLFSIFYFLCLYFLLQCFCKYSFSLSLCFYL